MTTALTIPAYARNAVMVAGQKTALTEAASGGVGSKAEFPHISIKQSRWRLVDVDGEEQVLKTFAISFAIVSINPNVSKAWYENKYNPGDEPSAPDCYSNNGIVPLPDADKIQSQQCATCDKNVWGSDVNPNNGNRLKACKDAKHIGVMFLDPDNLAAEEPTVYSQRLSAMSMINFSNFAKEVAAAGGALDYIVVKAEFDDQAEFPLIKYEVLRNMTEEEWNVVNRVRESERAVRVSNGDQKVIPIMAERVHHVPVRGGEPTGEMSESEVEAKRKAEAERMERVRAAQAEGERLKLANAAADKERMQKRAAELDAAQTTQVIDPAVIEKAKKLAALKAQMEALEAEAGGIGDDAPDVGADARNVTKITDAQEKPRQRHPTNTVNPEPASADMEDLLAQAMR